MAAEIKPVSSSNIPRSITPERPILISRVDGSQESINDVRLLAGGKTILSVCDDKSVRIWQRRDSGQYWPSVCHFLPSSPSCLFYADDNRKLFIGLENGTVTEYEVATDWNSITHTRDYLSHQSLVTGLIYDRNSEWMLSISRDKFLVYHCTESGRRLGGHQCSAGCTSIEYDHLSNHVFVGDYTGQILMIKLEENCYQVITTLKGHNGSVRSLAWDPARKLLFSGSFDQTIIVWDVGGKKGTAYELQGHTSKITSLKYAPESRNLVSGGEDCMVIFWDMGSRRLETPEWVESDVCQFCSRPFFWNIRAMVDQKQIGLRQHHCRKCGKAVCDSCSSNRSNLPVLGFEFEVRVCDKCFQNIKDSDRLSMAKFQEVKHSVVCLDIDEEAALLLTVGQDRVMKIWDASILFNKSQENSD
ncbi:WD repeat and FYVE domain-containing protein 2 [Armadillidium nasatum]|uniref:WD repeat and FYVE domain-containing protein 2 n=1 Tax=Armadillidium nasatum TaxID=96803 RepID=A0A5N5TIG2_9CRUS|nr:WD repeat and FYVE domain-containing protein 2 [Armadillidium nasatum]